MADFYETGTAIGYLNLLNKVRVFAAANGWVTDRDGIIDSVSGHTGADSGSYPNELVMHGLNDDGLGKIYVGMKAITGSDSDGPYFDWKLNGFDSFTPGNAFGLQPGAIPDADFPPLIPLSASPSVLTYWLVVNPRMMRLVVKVSSYYHFMYLGLLKQYASPGQLPYPLCVGGSRTSADGKFGFSNPGAGGVYHVGYFDPNGSSSASPCRIRRHDGTWSFVYNRDVGDSVVVTPRGATWPYWFNGISALRENISGDVNTLPVFVMDKDPLNALGNGSIFGEFDGVFAVPGIVAGTPQVSENTLGTGPTHIVFQNVYRTSTSKFMAFKVA